MSSTAQNWTSQKVEPVGREQSSILEVGAFRLSPADLETNVIQPTNHRAIYERHSLGPSVKVSITTEPDCSSSLTSSSSSVMFKNELMNSGFVRYFYDPEPKYDDQGGTPIWCLGREYTGPPPRPVSTTDHGDLVEIASSSADSHPPSDTTTSTVSTSPESPASGPPTSSSFDDASIVDGDVPPMNNACAEGGWPSAFLDDFESRIWMTYRSNFPPIPRSQDPGAASSMTLAVRLRNLADREGFSSDTGWGCMIRSGQSLLANTLIMLKQGRDWRKKRRPTSEEAAIVSLFADDEQAPFSIHRFVQHGAIACGKHPGQWFGPSATASCIKALSTECASAGLRVYVTSDSSDVYEDTFRSIAACDPSAQIQPTLILLGIRLGPDRITPVYYEALKSSLTYPQSIGIAGGRPSSSHHFIGCQGDSFFYLDPHETRPALPYHPDPAFYTEDELASMHTRRLRSLKISEMDPSMLLGFLVRDEEDWTDWKSRVRGGGGVKGKPIVRVYDKAPPGDGEMKEREGAVDEVETFDDDTGDEEEDTPTEIGL